MWLLLVPICLAIFSSSFTSASEPHYVITVNANLEQGTDEKACITFLDLKGPVDLKIELKKDDEVHIVAEQKINTHDHSACYTFQVPKIKDDYSVWLIHVSAHGEHINVDKSTKVVIIKRNDVCIIQTDKSTYKPGDIVKFRVMSVNHDFHAISKEYPLVEIIDPDRNHIGQWLDVSTKHGFADFTFHLANELTLGEYKINIPNDCGKFFKVDEYVPKRFEINLNTPSEIAATDQSLHLEVCGSYTYGKPVEGLIDLRLCADVYYYGQECESSDTEETNTLEIERVKTDSKGCVSRDIELSRFNFSNRSYYRPLYINAKLTEDSTGHSEKASTYVQLNPTAKTVQFVECEHFYHKGFPYHGKVKVNDEKKQPLGNKEITINAFSYEDYFNFTSVNVVTDSNGIAQFTLNTNEWQTFAGLKVHITSDDQFKEEDADYFGFQHRYPEDWLWLSPFYSKSESLLSIQKHSNDIPCNSEQSVTVEYDIHKKEFDPDTDHLHFFYILLTKSGIFSYNEQKVDIKDQANSPNLHGSVPLNFHVDEDFFPQYSLLVFSVLPNGETIAKATDYNVSPCAENKGKLSFSEEQVRPGENVNLKVTADPGSLCSVRSVDKGYLLKNPHDDHSLLTSVTERIRETIKTQYTHLTVDPESHLCPENTTVETEMSFDVYKLFLINNLQIITNTHIHVPVKCVSRDITARFATKKKKAEHKDTDKAIQKQFTRSYFPDTWLYELVPVGSEGHTVLNRTTPHSITKWETDAFCLGKSGFANLKKVELTTFQPYFLDLIVPYSVVQGEKFTIQAMVFSYVNKCVLIFVSLSDEDLIKDKDKEQTRCVCEGQSHTFSWDVSALKPKAQKIHVDSGSIEVEGDCTPDVLLIRNVRRKDSVEKTVVVKPRGHEEEKTKTFLLFPSDNGEVFTININAPERLVPDSERAHIIVLGDFMGYILVNIDNLVSLPDGCGEQSISKFSRYIYTLQYLESIQELTSEQKAKAIESLIEGYQKQLTFRTEDGAYAYFHGGPGNLWLTALVVKAFNDAQKFIHIDENHIKQAMNWLSSKQLPNGCFEVQEDYFNNELEANNQVTRTAYVTISLLEHHSVCNGSIVDNALTYLRNSADNVTSVYTQALLAYAFTLSGDNELRDQILKKLGKSAISKEGLKRWETNSYREGELETASYVVLALLSGKITTIVDLEDSGDIIRWIVTQQNPWGGFFSSQDTTVALQALAKYAKATAHKKGDSTVTITSKSGFQKTVHVNKRNSLLVQTVDLPEIPGEYSVSTTGNGLIYLQSHLHCNVLPEKAEEEHFSFNVSTEPSACTHASQKKFDVHVDVRYLGKRENTNMALILLETVSGFIPERDSIKKLKKNPLVEKTEISAQNISIYLTKLTHEKLSLVFSLEQEAHVENLQPAFAVVFDYYDPDEYTVAEYNAPCSSVVAHCAVTAAEREDCGRPNISKEECEQKGCCFDPSISGTKWCFFQGFKKTENH